VVHIVEKARNTSLVDTVEKRERSGKRDSVL